MKPSKLAALALAVAVLIGGGTLVGAGLAAAHPGTANQHVKRAIYHPHKIVRSA